MSEWISVKDRLPEKYAYVLWVRTDGVLDQQVVEGYYDSWPSSGMQFWRETRTPSIPRSLSVVSHWQPLPAPPACKRESEQ